MLKKNIFNYRAIALQQNNKAIQFIKSNEIKKISNISQSSSTKMIDGFDDSE